MTEEIELNNNQPTTITSGKVGYSYVVSKKIVGSYNTNGFFAAIIEGKRGIGKSSYALHILHDIFLTQGYTSEESWDMAIDRMLYTIPEIVSFLEKSEGDKREIAFCWDDAGVFGSNLRWFTHVKEITVLQSLMDTIRGSVSGMLLTAPNQFQLLKFLRRYDNFVIQIIYDDVNGHWYRIAKGYQKYTLPSGKQLVFHKFNDYFYVRLPNKIYNKYMQKRETYNRGNIESLIELMNKKKEVKKKHG